MARADLQLAWEFTTGSLEYTTGWMVAMRDDAFTRVPATGASYRIVSVEDEFNGKYEQRRPERAPSYRRPAAAF